MSLIKLIVLASDLAKMDTIANWSQEGAKGLLAFMLFFFKNVFVCLVQQNRCCKQRGAKNNIMVNKNSHVISVRGRKSEKKNDKKLRIILCTLMYSYFFFINSLLIYLCDIGILLKSSLGECHRHVCHVLLRILHNDILSTCICPFVFPQTSFINQYFYSIVISGFFILITLWYK